jgi:hypothetical protein
MENRQELGEIIWNCRKLSIYLLHNVALGGLCNTHNKQNGLYN